MKSIVKKKEVILLMDDEPHYLEWFVEYLEKKGYAIDIASNLLLGLSKLETADGYRAIIADLSVPVASEIDNLLQKEGKAYVEYPGLYLAQLARNRGYRARQVVVYSVHDSATVTEVANRIGVCYITKGRPKLLKEEIDNILSYDPTHH